MGYYEFGILLIVILFVVAGGTAYWNSYGTKATKNKTFAELMAKAENEKSSPEEEKSIEAVTKFLDENAPNVPCEDEGSK